MILRYGDGQITLSIPMSGFSINAYREAEADAKRMMDLAVETEGIKRYPEPFGSDDEWWMTVFGDTEQELMEQRSGLARRHQSLGLFKRKERFATLRAYIRLDAQLMTARGLTCGWW